MSYNHFLVMFCVSYFSVDYISYYMIIIICNYLPLSTIIYIICYYFYDMTSDYRDCMYNPEMMTSYDIYFTMLCIKTFYLLITLYM